MTVAEDRGSGNKPSHTKCARIIMADNHFLTLRDTGEILYYENGTFREGGEIIIKEEAEKLVGNCTINARRKIIESIRNRTCVDRSAFDTNPFLLNVKNGVLNLETMKLMDHTPSLLFRSQVDAAYDGNAKADRYRKFIGEVLESERDRTLIHELFASALLRSHLNLEKAAILVGPGSSGKTTLLHAMTAVFGEDNISAVSIHDLIYQRFARSSLDGKMLNIYADISSQKLDRTGIIKSMISGDRIAVERKNKPSYMMEPYAVMVFAANRLPEVNGDTNAICRRFVIINFRRQFMGKDRDPMLLASLTTEEEKSGILNILLEHAKLLLKNKKLTHDPTMVKIQAEWHDGADPIIQFINAYIVKAKDSSEDKSDMFAAYVEFCQGRHHVAYSQSAFAQRMQRKGFRDKTVKKDGKTRRAWIDVRLKESAKSPGGGPSAGGSAGMEGGSPAGETEGRPEAAKAGLPGMTADGLPKMPDGSEPEAYVYMECGAGPWMNDVGMFITERIEREPKHSEDKSDMFAAYVEFCQGRHHVAYSQSAFAQRMQRKGFRDKTVKKDGKTRRAWIDVRLKESAKSPGGGPPAGAQEPVGQNQKAGF